MWLLNVEDIDHIYLRSFNERNTPPYAILSHTWLEDNDQEISFQDMKTGLNDQTRAKKGYTKVYHCVYQARRDGYKYCWIDTCCINKESSAELSEAINSMFLWYKEAGICYAFLTDVDAKSDLWTKQFAKAKWFTRGWTLQELLAPSEVRFFDKKWRYIGTKADNVDDIARIAGIGPDYLTGQLPIQKASVAARMSWAARRETTREEDIAYCLLGIFDINMSLLYGERTKAFRRLQEEILKEHDDQSILAWSPVDPAPRGVLARSPADFLHCGTVENSLSMWSANGLTMTPKGLRMHLAFASYNSELVAILRCKDSSSGSFYAIPVTNHHGNLEQDVELYRVPGRPVILLPRPIVTDNRRIDFLTVLLARAASVQLRSNATAWMHSFAVRKSYRPSLNQSGRLKLEAIAWWPKCDIGRGESEYYYYFNPPNHQKRHMVVLLGEQSSPNGGACCLAMGFRPTACGAIDTQRHWANYIIDAYGTENVRRKARMHRNDGLSREDAYAKAWYEEFHKISLQRDVSQQPFSVETREEVFTISIDREKDFVGFIHVVKIDRASRTRQ